jgi:hypothetical protein
MKNKFKILLAGAVQLLVIVSLTTNVSANQPQPGSNEDPLVSRSYVDQRINEALRGGGNLGAATITEQEKQAIVTQVFLQVIEFNNLNNIGEASSIYKPVNLLAGERIIGHEGTEIILRSGQAVAYTRVQNGLVNVTTGEEILNNTNIATNNLLIVPRHDGRGLTATTEVWLLVKGEYEIIR